MNKFRAYRDGDRYIIGRPEDQTCYSQTRGFATAYSQHEAREKIRELEANPPTREPKVYWTDERFEDACDAGEFGPAWD